MAALISVCLAVYRRHGPPNLESIGAALPSALGAHPGELVVALNGISAADAQAPADATTVDLGVNRGVAPAWNAAACAARGELLVFCNDDVELGAGSLAALADVLLAREDAGVVGPVGSTWDLVRGRHLDFVTAREGEPPARCDVVSGFLFACRRTTWEAVGGFDEFYAPASFEEVDFCAAVRSIGLGCFAVAGVEQRHEWGVSRRQPPWARARWDGRSETWRSIHRRNRRHLLEKWGDSPVARSAPAP